MGLLDASKERTGQRRRAKAQAAADKALRSWQAQADHLDRLVAEAQSFAGEPIDSGAAGIALKKGERVFLAHEPVGLVHDTPQVVDRGFLTITSHRAVFHGGRHLRQWPFGSINSYQHVPHSRRTTIYASVCYVLVNKQQLSGFVCTTPDRAARTRFQFDLAFARHRKCLGDLVERLESDRAEHEQIRPG